MKLTVTNEEMATLVAGWTKIYTYSDNAGPPRLYEETTSQNS